MSFLILIGMMGSGKTTVGRMIAERNDLPFLDTDQMLINRLGRPIHQLFQLYGEDAFRDHETSVLASLEPQTAILSTGGGIVLRDANWEHFKRLGTTITLDATIPVLKNRLENAKRRRPLLETENWEETLQKIYDSRRHLYLKSDIVIDISDRELQEIVELVEKEAGLV